MKKITGGVTAAKGFEAAAAAAGIKYENRTDMALVYSVKPCKVAGTFTTNVVKAAPVKWDRQIVESKIKSQAVIINSGIANACTGEEGMRCCLETAKAAAEALKIPADGVLIGSTGVIGMQMPIEKIKKGIQILAKENSRGQWQQMRRQSNHDHRYYGKRSGSDRGDWREDRYHWRDGQRIRYDSSEYVHHAGFSYNRCGNLQKALKAALCADVEETYNMISVDGDTSTNDTVLLLANGMAENPKIKEGTKEFEIFAEALHEVNETLAKKMAGDGEGATALFEVTVRGADTKEQAKTLAKSVVCSNLTKAAIAGHDANWGRILCAMGYSGAEFDPEKVDLYFKSSAGELKIIENGVALDYSEEKATEILSMPEVTAIADLGQGEETATAWGCDLYPRIYRYQCGLPQLVQCIFSKKTGRRSENMNENMNQYLEKAKVLIEALPYIQRFNRKIIVVKYGGSAMTDEALKSRK